MARLKEALLAETKATAIPKSAVDLTTLNVLSQIKESENKALAESISSMMEKLNILEKRITDQDFNRNQYFNSERNFSRNQPRTNFQGQPRDSNYSNSNFKGQGRNRPSDQMTILGGNQFFNQNGQRSSQYSRDNYQSSTSSNRGRGPFN